eukprot:m51a1_g7355 hypothetical protein (209) ;mRNA; r:29357-30196
MSAIAPEILLEATQPNARSAGPPPPRHRFSLRYRDPRVEARFSEHSLRISRLRARLGLGFAMFGVIYLATRLLQLLVNAVVEAVCMALTFTRFDRHRSLALTVTHVISAMNIVDITTSAFKTLDSFRTITVIPLFLSITSGLSSQKVSFVHFLFFCWIKILGWALYAIVRKSYVSVWELCVSIVLLSLIAVFLCLQCTDQTAAALRVH